MSGLDFDRMRAAMVSNQLRTNAVSDAPVLAAMSGIPREAFVPPESAGVAYRDTIVPLGHGRGLNPPIAIGRLLDAAAPRRGERVLVVGAATGYVPALLAELGCQVTAIEEVAELAALGKAALAGTAGVTYVEGPLAQGWAASAPYDILYIDGSVPDVPDTLIDQVVEGGRIVCALDDRGVSRLAFGRKVAGGCGFGAFADVETVPLTAFAKAPAFTF